MNRIKPLWVGSIFLTILLFFLCACSTMTGNKTPSTQAGTGATAMEDQIAQAVFQAINQSRAANGLPPLKWSTALAKSARLHDLTMQAANTWHTNCRERPPLAIAKDNRVSIGHGRQRISEKPV